MPDVTPPSEDGVTPGDIEDLLERTQIQDVRVDEIHAGPVIRFAEEIQVRWGQLPPQFAVMESEIFVRIGHEVEFFDGTDAQDDDHHHEDEDEDDDRALAKITVHHVASFSFDGGAKPSNDVVSIWIDANVYFMVYPYARQSIQTLAVALGMPPLVLGYLKRD